MPLDNLFKDSSTKATSADRRQILCEAFGVPGNPFPSAAQTSGNPHMEIDQDRKIDSAVAEFYDNRKSHVIAITASQGIGKTNVLNAYETALKEKLVSKGFFVIRYIADPEPTFDPLIRSIIEHMGENHLRQVATTLNEGHSHKLEEVRTKDTRMLLQSLVAVIEDEDRFANHLILAQQWLLGLPVRKAHREELGVQFRLDTVESKTRALRDIVYLSASIGLLQGVFLLLDELEKQDFSRSKTIVLQYLSALRALIDAFPRYLFLMVALTTDSLQRYREMLPALKGRLADEIELSPIESSDKAIEYFNFYLEQAKKAAIQLTQDKHWKMGHKKFLSEEEAEEVFEELLEDSLIEGVRQRDYLNQLHKKAQSIIDDIV